MINRPHINDKDQALYTNQTNTKSILKKMNLRQHIPSIGYFRAVAITSLLLPYLTFADDLITYFTANETDCKVVTDSDIAQFNSTIEALHQGICGVITNVTKIPLSYDLIKSWTVADGRFNVANLASLFAGSQQYLNETIKNCLIELLDKAYQDWQDEKDRDFKESLIAGLGTVGGIIVAGSLISAIFFYLNRRNASNVTVSVSDPTHPALEANTHPQVSIVNNNTPATDEKSKPQQKESLAERFGKLELNPMNPEVENFFCPIMHEIMTNPVVISSGLSYERSAIEESIKRGNQRCPLTNKIIKEVIPNINLKNVILGYIDRKEAAQKISSTHQKSTFFKPANESVQQEEPDEKQPLLARPQ